MASSSSVREEAAADEVEGFNDFTTASAWERLISNIEKICRKWHDDGLKKNLVQAEIVQGSRNLRHIKADFTYETKPYCLEYFFEVDNSKGNITSGDIDQWRDGLHFLQLWFGIKDFLIIAPQSMSGVVLDAPEATKLLSAVAIALSNCDSAIRIWPSFVPVHDPTRKAYKGIQNMDTTLTRRFEADRIGSQVPVKLMHLEGLYELFMSKLAFASSDSFAPIIQVHYTMRLTYRTHISGHELEHHEENESRSTETRVSMESDLFNNRQWDDDFPWSEWYSAEDPVKGFELITIWSDKVVESSVEMAEFENASVLEADKWFLVPITIMDVNNFIQNSPVGFASRLCALVEAFSISFEGQFVEDFVTAENPRIQSVTASAVVPPPTVLDRVLKDLFHEGPPKAKSSLNGHKYTRNIKGAPLESLFTQFSLHSLWFGSCNIRAISVLWVEFVREVRWCWEELQPLPMMSNDGTIDLTCCLVYQKLQMLAVCINKKKMEHKKHRKRNKNKDSDQREDAKQVEIKPLERNAARKDNSHDILHKERGSFRPTEGVKDIGNSEASMSYLDNHNEATRSDSENRSLHQGRRGSAGPARDLMLLKTCQKMHVPFTQDIPIMTQDMHEERQQAIEALSDSLDGKNLHAQLEKEILASDMAAFKAANPEAVFEDFIRWHSPGDWIDDSLDKTMEGHECIGQENSEIKNSWPPRGRLSERMSEAGNSWHQIWNNVQAMPASEQKPLFDPDREGEKVLHYLETLRPNQLLGQVICTAFSGAADTLNKTEFGGQRQMITKIEQLYLTIASTLKPLQGQQLCEELEDFLGQLQRLCSVFEEIERLVIFAASLHQKLGHVHRLATVIFDEHLKHSTQRKCITQGNSLNEEFRIKQSVRRSERDSVAALFSPPSPSQSWRKVLSMGNFLNGHEPLSREVVFSLDDNIGHRQYGNGSLERDFHQKMYICGTSNDLQVAFAVTSSD